MALTPGQRKLVRTVHVTVAVGWLGAVASFLALAIAGLSSRDMQLVRGVYLGMDLIARYVIVPLSLVPLLLTGPLLSLGTPWGLFRHYWILAKLLINVFSTLALLVHLQPIGYLARAATAGTMSRADYRVQVQMVVAAAAALLVLLMATALAVYKPRGITPYGWRKQHGRRAPSTVDDAAS